MLDKAIGRFRSGLGGAFAGLLDDTAGDGDVRMVVLDTTTPVVHVEPSPRFTKLMRCVATGDCIGDCTSAHRVPDGR